MTEQTEQKTIVPDQRITAICKIKATPQGYSLWIPRTAFEQADKTQ